MAMSWWQVLLIGCGGIVLFNVLFVFVIEYGQRVVSALQQLIAAPPRRCAGEAAAGKQP